MKHWLLYSIDSFRELLSPVGRYVVMGWDILRTMCTKGSPWSLIIEQSYTMGAKSVPLVCITGIATGLVLAAQAFFQLSDKGFSSMTGVMVAKSMLVEIGPLLTAFMITGRVGAAMCAELGSMKVTEQIDAMQSIGVSPYEYLLVPRYWAMILTMPLLTIFSSASGLLGGWFLSTQLYGVSSLTFFEPLPLYISWFDLISNIIKSTIFGLLIVSIACFQGLKTTGGAAGVGRATTSCVVTTYSCILGVNFLLTLFFHTAYWYIFGF